MKKLSVSLVAAAILAIPPGDDAQAAVYRCPDGSFSDKPCGQDGKLVMKTRKTPPPPSQAVDPYAQRNQRAARPTPSESEPRGPAVTSLGGEGSRSECESVQRSIDSVRREQRDNFQRAYEAEDNNASRRALDQYRRDRGC